jgi:predicted LPLAT superfamily acyltransferase
VAEWKGKSRGNVLGYKIFVAFLKYLGLRPAYFLLRFVAFYFFLFSGKSSACIFNLYRRKLNYGFFRSLRMLYRNYFVFGQVLLDKTAMMAGFRSPFTFDFDGEDHLRQMAADGTGCLFISAHLGNFEMAGHMLERLDARINVIMLDAEYERIKEYIESFTRKSFNIIAIRPDQSHIYEISSALENKEVICIHGDRFLEGSKTIRSAFLGTDARFPGGPFYLAMKYGVPVSFVFAMKEGKSHYHFYASPPRLYKQQGTLVGREETLKQIVTDYVSEVEKKVRQYPEQWFNYYDFWA